MAQGMVAEQKVVLFGGSAGSIEALLGILPHLHAGYPYPVILVLHRRSAAEDVLADLLAAKTSMKVKEVEEKDMLEGGTIYIAPGDYHLLFEQDNTLSLDDSERVNYSRPSIDVSFQSAADVFGPSLVCILLSGANADGTVGFGYAKEKGSTIVAQLPASAEVDYMPRQAILNNPVDHILDLAQIAAYLQAL